jgi:hypothetical protein
MTHMMNSYGAEKYTALRQAEERESARLWRLARDLRSRPRVRGRVLPLNIWGTRQEPGETCARGSRRSARPS